MVALLCYSLILGRPSSALNFFEIFFHKVEDGDFPNHPKLLPFFIY